MDTTMKLVKLGREMITQAEENTVFAKDDKKWNTCVVAGNKLTTIGTVWGLQDIKDLKQSEREIVLEFLDLNKGLLS
jgi:hypothetical protein|tara:strand:- start:1501 stop:1731 length:231 start_codon:yes stop_codon:yes gene_type:complete